MYVARAMVLSRIEMKCLQFLFLLVILCFSSVKGQTPEDKALLASANVLSGLEWFTFTPLYADHSLEIALKAVKISDDSILKKTLYDSMQFVFKMMHNYAESNIDLIQRKYAHVYDLNYILVEFAKTYFYMVDPITTVLADASKPLCKTVLGIFQAITQVSTQRIRIKFAIKDMISETSEETSKWFKKEWETLNSYRDMLNYFVFHHKDHISDLEMLRRSALDLDFFALKFLDATDSPKYSPNFSHFYSKALNLIFSIQDREERRNREELRNREQRRNREERRNSEKRRNREKRRETFRAMRKRR